MKSKFNYVLSSLFLTIFSISSFVCSAQSDSTATVVAIQEITPQFPGGWKEMHKFIDRHLKYPSGAPCAEGKVFVLFTVEEDGCITNVKTVKGIHPACDAEAERVVKLFPKWIPGKQGDTVVPMRMALPIEFDLKRGD